MSKASASRNVTYIRKSGIYTTTIMSSSGDLWQEYTESGDTMSVTPNWAELKPTLEMVVISSRVATGRTSVESNQITWYFNDTEIKFDSAGKDTNFGGIFLKVSGTVDSKTVQKLQITDNIVTIAGKSSCVIKAEVAIVEDSTSDTLQATYTIPVQQSSGNSYRVTISAGDDKNFVIDEKDGTCVLKANVYFDGVLGTNAYTYQWYKLSGTDWVAAGTGQTITVKEGSIDTYAEYKVEATLAGVVIGSDIQGVMDTTDPYIIAPTPTPQNEVIYDTWGAKEGITYNPKVTTRGGTALTTQPTFDFKALDSYGNTLGSAENASEFTVTKEMCEQAGGDVNLIINSNEF
jgi:hypothetical protein